METTEFKLTLLSPERRWAENVMIDQLILTGSEGQIQILPGHAPMVGVLHPGVFAYSLEGQPPVVGVISHGFFQVQLGEVVIMADHIELKDEIDPGRAQKAQKLAREALEQGSLDESQFRKYQLKLQRALVRQQVAAGSIFGKQD